MAPIESDQPFLDAEPPPWATRGLAWLLLLIAAAAATGVVLVQVPETVVARFVLVPVSGSDPIRALHDGIITEVHARDAQAVSAGETLFVISSEEVGDRTAEREELGTSLSGGPQRLTNERQKYENQRRADEEAAARLQQRIVALEEQVRLTEQQAALAREVAARQQKSYEEGLISWIDASRPKLEADRLTAEAEQTRSNVAEARAAAAQLRFEMASRRAAFDEVTRSVEEELARARTRTGLLDREESRKDNTLSVTAPCAGTIVRLLVRTPGTAVSAFDVLGELTCRDERLQAELQVPQQGMALINLGQPVKLRYDAFPYQRYGVRYGTVRWVSPAAASQPSAVGTFRALADLDEQTLQIGAQVRQTLPGMGGEASIIVGRRSLLSYAVDPLRQIREGLSAGRPR
jgi:multidrug efflux pump subunit AcrA (membrane-fusion protein)